jgi:hypothetical protein
VIAPRGPSRRRQARPRERSACHPVPPAPDAAERSPAIPSRRGVWSKSSETGYERRNHCGRAFVTQHRGAAMSWLRTDCAIQPGCGGGDARGCQDLRCDGSRRRCGLPGPTWSSGDCMERPYRCIEVAAGTPDRAAADGARKRTVTCDSSRPACDPRSFVNQFSIPDPAGPPRASGPAVAGGVTQPTGAMRWLPGVPCSS